MNVFVTGATGFIGGYLVNRLLESGYELRCLVRKDNEASQRLRRLGVTLAPGDVTDKASLLRGMGGCDWVIHLAGLYSFWERDRRAFTEVNVNGTRNVMECALETKVAKVVHVSTVGVYGKPVDSPFREESEVGPDRFCDYFRTKYEGDRLVWELFKARRLPVVVVYPAAVIGPGDTKTTGQYMMNLIRRRLPATVFNDGVLTFVHVKDVAEVIVRAAEKDANIGERYIAGKHQFSFREINRMVSEASGVPLPKLHLPDVLTMASATLLTWLSRLTRKPPVWMMFRDQMMVMREGFKADGSKAERELCISYTPIREAIEEAVASIMGEPEESVAVM